MKATVYVTYKSGVLDPQGQTIHEVLQQHGHPGVNNVRVGKMIELDLEDMDRVKAKAMVEKISDQVLANPIIESFRVEIP